jgi:drug/metabolite transporter (DMT)-like permease
MLVGGRLVLGRDRVWGALTLAVYMLGFSWAYVSLGAGVGALILFGTVQLVMFGWAAVSGGAVPPLRWVGVGVAFCGLALLLWPQEALALPIIGSLSMIAAGAGWAAYSLLGQRARQPLVATAGNFVLCLPLMLLPLAVVPVTVTGAGAITALVAGALTSGLGYAPWYRVLPHLAATTAATAQLSVPVIAVAGGALLLAEPVTPRLVVSAILVLGGIGLSLARR